MFLFSLVVPAQLACDIVVCLVANHPDCAIVKCVIVLLGFCLKFFCFGGGSSGYGGIERWVSTAVWGFNNVLGVSVM